MDARVEYEGVQDTECQPPEPMSADADTFDLWFEGAVADVAAGRSADLRTALRARLEARFADEATGEEAGESESGASDSGADVLRYAARLAADVRESDFATTICGGRELVALSVSTHRPCGGDCTGDIHDARSELFCMVAAARHGRGFEAAIAGVVELARGLDAGARPTRNVVTT
ncbi:MAG: hypothetical protein AB7Q17_15310 [Phycisphaerae bacterium]